MFVIMIIIIIIVCLSVVLRVDGDGASLGVLPRPGTLCAFRDSMLRRLGVGDSIEFTAAGPGRAGPGQFGRSAACLWVGGHRRRREFP